MFTCRRFVVAVLSTIFSVGIVYAQDKSSVAQPSTPAPAAALGAARADRVGLSNSTVRTPESSGPKVSDRGNEVPVIRTPNRLAKFIDAVNELGDSSVTDTDAGLKVMAPLDVVGEINTSTQFNIAHDRVFSTDGFGNTFAGHSAGGPDKFRRESSSDNSFFGWLAGFHTMYGGIENSFFGSFAGTANTSGASNSFFGRAAGNANTTGSRNSFFGNSAGFNNATSGNSFFGSSAGRANTLGGNNSFFGNEAGLSNTASGNSFFGSYTGRANTTGSNNSFFGNEAGLSNTASGNSFFGNSAGRANLTGGSNSFFGNSAGLRNTDGESNSFFGESAGAYNRTGADNSFFGETAGNLNTTGAGNSFFGHRAGFLNGTGGNNIAIGNSAGSRLTTGDNNIYMGNAGANESNTIRIGTRSVQSSAFIAGISGVTSASGVTVLVNPNGQLGTLTSSRRYKKDIRDMGNSSSKLMQLRPVIFRYRPEYVDGEQTLQYGLIAEEVATVYPELVQNSADGRPQAVRYHLLNTMLLNEAQKQQRQIESQEQQLQTQARQISSLAARLRHLEAIATRRLGRVRR